MQRTSPRWGTTVQVICMCGDGGLSMLFGDLMTTVQENLPIKIVVYDNSKLGFVEIEQRAEGMLDLYTDLKNPDFGKVAEALGLWGRTVDKAGRRVPQPRQERSSAPWSSRTRSPTRRPFSSR